MNIVFSSSDLYAKCTGVALYSILENNKDLEELNFYILTTDMKQKNENRLSELCEKYGRKIVIIHATDMLLEAQKAMGLLDFKGGLNTYARVLANKVMPPEIETALFIDADLMNVSSFKELENLDMGDNIVAGVYEIAVMIKNLCYEDLNLLNQCPHYINYGVAYISLTNWRKFDGDKLIRECIQKAQEPFRIAEQSILNLAFKDHTLILPVKYNFFTALHGIKYETICKWYQRKIVFEKEEYEEASKNPVVIHFIGDYFNRPWYENNICRYRDDYMKYYLGSPWGNEPLDKEPDDYSAFFKIYYKVLIYLRKNGYDTLYFKLRYVLVQWIRQHIPNMDKRIKRKV